MAPLADRLGGPAATDLRRAVRAMVHPGVVRPTARLSAGRRLPGPTGVARRPAVLQPAATRAAVRGVVHRRCRRHRTPPHRPDGVGPDRAHHPRRLPAVLGGRQAGVPDERRRHRGVRAAGHGRRHPRDHRRAHRPHQVLVGGVAARRRRVLLRAPPGPRHGRARRGPVPPARAAAPPRRRPRHRRRDLRRRTADHELLLRRSHPRRSLAGDRLRRGNSAAQRRLPGGPHRHRHPPPRTGHRGRET